ncbi:MAG: hypothetical protein FWG50_11905 [Kiritimatiellaeota bacterium]|nr:hypothetical protein [Kiritimatiellota bacterium]
MKKTRTVSLKTPSAEPRPQMPPETWEHTAFWRRVKDALNALPVHFRSDTFIEGINATDIFTLNSALGERQSMSLLSRTAERMMGTKVDSASGDRIRRASGQRPEINSTGQRPEINSTGQRPEINSTGQRPEINSTGQRPVLATNKACRLKAYYQWRRTMPCVHDARPTALSFDVFRSVGRCPTLLSDALSGLRPYHDEKMSKQMGINTCSRSQIVTLNAQHTYNQGTMNFMCIPDMNMQSKE